MFNAFFRNTRYFLASLSIFTIGSLCHAQEQIHGGRVVQNPIGPTLSNVNITAWQTSEGRNKNIGECTRFEGQPIDIKLSNNLGAFSLQIPNDLYSYVVVACFQGFADMVLYDQLNRTGLQIQPPIIKLFPLDADISANFTTAFDEFINTLANIGCTEAGRQALSDIRELAGNYELTGQLRSALSSEIQSQLGDFCTQANSEPF